MREIKFRAWYTKSNKWLDDVMIDLKGVPESYSDNDGGKEGLWEHALGNWKDTIISQYTGLKDKNDKEIYEGDIVTYQYNGNLILNMKVEWLKGGFYLTDETIYERPSRWIPGACEIIGNIYENPELLKES